MEKHYEYKNAPQVCSETISFDYIDGKIFRENNSDYLQKARKYGHFTGYKN